MSRIVHKPAQEHTCPPTRSREGSWRTQHGHRYDFECDKIGTVRMCDCGKTWVALPRRPGLGVTVYRPEGWLERKLREWRS